jgi:hypothetical protein
MYTHVGGVKRHGNPRSSRFFWDGIRGQGRWWKTGWDRTGKCYHGSGIDLVQGVCTSDAVGREIERDVCASALSVMWLKWTFAPVRCQ